MNEHNPALTTPVSHNDRGPPATGANRSTVVSRAQIDIALAAANIVSSYVSKNAMTFASVPKMIADVHATIVTLIKTSERIEYAELASAAIGETSTAESPTTQTSARPAAVASSSPQPNVIPQQKIINAAALTAARSPVKAIADGAQPESKNAFKAEFVISEPTRTPAVPVELSIYEDRIFCLACGKIFATLSRHLKMTHEMSDIDYRATYGLSPSYPMSCKAFLDSRASLIKGSNFRPSTKEEIAAKRQLTLAVDNVPTESSRRAAPPAAAAPRRNERSEGPDEQAPAPTTSDTLS